MNTTALWNFLKLTRPLFLAGGFLLYTLGALAALVDGAAPQLLRFALGQLVVTCIQLMTHYANEYYDQECDRLNTRRTWFSGGSGVLVGGHLTARVAQRAALAFAALGVLALLVAGAQVPAALWIGALALAAAWSYSGPPLTLVRTGWGELMASLVVAGMVPLMGYAMQSGGALSGGILIVTLPLVLLHFAMLIAFQVPDCEADALTGKTTLCVRMGMIRTARIHHTSLLLAFCVMLVLVAAGWPGAQIAWLGLPLAAWQVAAFRQYLEGESPRYLWLTTRALSLFALTTALWLAGYLWIWLRG